MAEIITKILFLLAVIDPLGFVPVFLEATKHFDERHKKKIAVPGIPGGLFYIIVFYPCWADYSGGHGGFSRSFSDLWRGNFISFCANHDFW